MAILVGILTLNEFIQFIITDVFNWPVWVTPVIIGVLVPIMAWMTYFFLKWGVKKYHETGNHRWPFIKNTKLGAQIGISSDIIL